MFPDIRSRLCSDFNADVYGWRCYHGASPGRCLNGMVDSILSSASVWLLPFPPSVDSVPLIIL